MPVFDFIAKNKAASPQNQAVFARELQTLLTSGFPLPKAVSIMAMERRGCFGNVLYEVRERLIKGESLSACFAAHPEIFPTFIREVIARLEKGNLNKSLSVLAGYSKKSAMFEGRIKKSFLFPVFLSGSVIPGSIISRTPLISHLMAKYNAVLISRQLSSLLEAGIPLEEALSITKKSIKNPLCASIVEEMSGRIGRGEDLLSTFGFSTALYPGAVTKAAARDKNRRVSEALDKIADYYQDEVKVAVDRITEVLGAGLAILLGVILASFLTSFILID